MRIAVAADHAGYQLKEAIKRALAGSVEIEDLGTQSEASVDYPDFAAAAARLVAAGSCDRAVLFCGTGIGMALAANKIPGIRAAAVWSAETVRLAREHNDANVIALGARIVTPGEAAAMVRIFLDTPFAGGRHKRRIDKVAALEAAQVS